MGTASLAPVPEHPPWIGQPLNLRKKPTALKIMCPDHVRYRKDGQLPLFMSVWTFPVPKQHCCSFTPRKELHWWGRMVWWVSWEQTWSCRAPLPVLNRALAPAETTTASASPSTISITQLPRMVHSLDEKENYSLWLHKSRQEQKHFRHVLFCFGLLVVLFVFLVFLLRSIRWGCILWYKVSVRLLWLSRAGHEFLPAVNCESLGVTL